LELRIYVYDLVIDFIVKRLTITVLIRIVTIIIDIIIITIYFVLCDDSDWVSFLVYPLVLKALLLLLLFCILGYS
jgi:hypothetical protein